MSANQLLVQEIKSDCDETKDIWFTEESKKAHIREIRCVVRHKAFHKLSAIDQEKYSYAAILANKIEKDEISVIEANYEYAQKKNEIASRGAMGAATAMSVAPIYVPPQIYIPSTVYTPPPSPPPMPVQTRCHRTGIYVNCTSF